MHAEYSRAEITVAGFYLGGVLAIGGSGKIRGPALVSNERHKPAEIIFSNGSLAIVFLKNLHLLFGPSAYGQHESSTIGELIDQALRNPGRRRSHQNLVERRLLGEPAAAIAVYDMNIRVSQSIEDLTRRCCQFGMPFNRPHL